MSSNCAHFLSALPPLHLLCFSFLLGATLYQSFIMTKISYRALPKAAFRSLQKQAWPFYFRSQSLLVVITAVTIPRDDLVPFEASLMSWVPHAVAFTSAMLNTFIFEPATRKAMVQVTHQETRDGLSCNLTQYDENKVMEGASVSASSGMVVVKRRFSFSHAMCIHLNLLTLGAVLAYGWTLAARIR
ncbi:hypothetical protein QC764_401420 [Podospora pseudoanserina]|uniref:TMEM205-like domain-containing protein n=1 Tax=Podospora pseudoanserina TaxID=2609844 RepID=A0ABR0I8M1_9PEZI|nr:hypothetical protein QC764_401420 [Podospora pseudoanserina]